MPPLYAITSKQPCSHIELVSVTPILSTLTLMEAVEQMRKERRRAAPVWDQNKHSFVGVCDIRSLLGELLFNQQDAIDSHVPLLKSESNAEFENMKCHAGPAGDIALQNELDILAPETKLHEALAVFGRGSFIIGVQTDEEKESLDGSLQIITQGRFLQYLLAMPQFRSFLDEFTNKSLGDVNRNVVKARIDSSIMSTMRTMGRQYTSCIAIVDEKGRLVDNLSLTDSFDLLKHKDENIALTESVKDYISRVRQSKFIRDLVFRDGTSLRVIVKTMLRKRILHAWIIDDKDRPKQCISATDIFKLVYIEMRKMKRLHGMAYIEEDDEDIVPAIFESIYQRLNFISVMRLLFFLWCVWKIRQCLSSLSKK